jgi:cellulose synthase/poly-beta-1,6-N-acetylglucosamine synthase-like glycosyltransferase
MYTLHHVLELLFVSYFAALNTAYTLLLALGSGQVSDWVRRRPMRDFRGVSNSPLSLPVTILVPAYNEAPIIVHSIRALLASRYREFQVMVVNDGSTDGTLAALMEAFGLVPVERVPRARLESAAVRAIYASSHDKRLLVIDKDNGGKADALNCGIRYAAFPLFCAIDSDTVLDPDALARLVWAFQAEPETVATGGIVRIFNGSRIVGGRIHQVRTPRSMLVNIQIVEYLRAFLAGRAGWSRLNMLLIISGAFGLFRRDVVVEAGGYDTTTIGEDAELIVRLHRHCREQGRRYKITFVADPICWTEAPADRATLARQRDRWQRGLLETLWRHRSIIGRRRYGGVGLVGMPFFLVFEAVGPLVEVVGLLYTAVGLAAGWVAPAMAALIVALAFTYGLVLSFGALLIEGRAFARYPDWRDLGRLMLAAMGENFGYRQWLAVIRARAWWTVLRPSRDWGEMVRTGLGEPVAIALAASAPRAPSPLVPGDVAGPLLSVAAAEHVPAVRAPGHARTAGECAAARPSRARRSNSGAAPVLPMRTPTSAP